MGNQQQCLKAGRRHIIYLISQNSVSRPSLTARKAGKSILYAGWPCAWLKREDSIIKKKKIDMGEEADSRPIISSNLP